VKARLGRHKLGWDARRIGVISRGRVTKLDDVQCQFVVEKTRWIGVVRVSGSSPKRGSGQRWVLAGEDFQKTTEGVIEDDMVNTQV
jgi:hypothetical protein